MPPPARVNSSLPLLYSGKVRDIYSFPAERLPPSHRGQSQVLLMVASDRISAFDVILANEIPGKGKVLTAVSRWWFERLAGILPSHVLSVDVDALLTDEEAHFRGRSMLVEKLEMLPIEAVVRARISGSGWRDYCDTGAVGGVKLPTNLPEGEELPEPIFTPATKAPKGGSDENIDWVACCQRIGEKQAEEVRKLSLALFKRALIELEQNDNGLILADTKFEFGTDARGVMKLADEVLTPDSSRYWDRDHWLPGISPPSFDKQYVRDYLSGLEKGWSRENPPALPAEVVSGTLDRYVEVARRLGVPAVDL